MRATPNQRLSNQNIKKNAIQYQKAARGNSMNVRTFQNNSRNSSRIKTREEKAMMTATTGATVVNNKPNLPPRVVKQSATNLRSASQRASVSDSRQSQRKLNDSVKKNP